jgi:hypothetical protein
MAQVSETLEIDPEQTRLVAQKDFITPSCRESFNSYGLIFSL